MGVGEDAGRLTNSGHGNNDWTVRARCVAIDVCRLRPGVDNLLPSLVHGQIIDRSIPAVIFVQCDRCDGCRNGLVTCADCLGKGNHQAFRADAILIITVVPNLPDADVGSLGRVAVGYGGNQATSGCTREAVTLGQTCLVLFPAVLDSCAVIIRRQALNRNLPLVTFVQRDRPSVALRVLYWRHICISTNLLHQIDGDGFRPLAVLVVGVIPDLLDRDIDRRWIIGIGKRGNGTVLGRIRKHVAFGQSTLGPRVHDLLSVGIFREVIDRSLPIIVGVQRHLGAVGESNLQLGRPLAVLVVVVIPDLLDGGLGELGRMLVGDGRNGSILVRTLKRVARGQPGLGPRVYNLRSAVVVLRQAGNGSGPAVLLVQRDAITIGEGDGQAFWADAVLVIRVVPDLLDSGIGLLVFDLIGDSDFGGAAIRSGIAIRNVL